MSDENLGEFRDRLKGLLAEAREQDLLAEVESLWSELFDASKPDDSTLDLNAPEVPMRFGMIGDSEPMQRVFQLIERVAPSEVSVLINGETGTGKELCARAMHEHSKRKKKPFLAENCAAVPANLLESELFGHAKGSFTGAIADRQGHFAVADGGTIFLDEIGDMPLEMQSKLLRVLQDGEIRPVGSNKSRKVDVRVVAATNKDLEAGCRDGSFRQDLYYRLNVITILLPPLRDRDGDIEHLTRFLLYGFSKELGREVSIAPDALAALGGYAWPGNVRELENELKRAAVMSGGAIGLSDLSAQISNSG